MKTKIKFALLSIFSFGFILINSSCNELLFEKMMPNNAEIITKIPSFFDGKWIEIYFDQSAVSVAIHEIEKKSNMQCLVYITKKEYLDSLSLSRLNLGEIDSVVFLENKLYVHGKDSMLTLTLDDTLKSSPKKLEYDINLKDNYFNQIFSANPNTESDKKKCELRLHNNAYFLNIQEKKGNFIVKIENKDNEILLTPTIFNIESETTEFNKIIDKYRFKDISNQDKSNKSLYLANSSDEEFNEIINRGDIFNTIRWQKINTDYTLFWLFSFLGLLIVGVVGYSLMEK